MRCLKWWKPQIAKTYPVATSLDSWMNQCHDQNFENKKKTNKCIYIKNKIIFFWIKTSNHVDLQFQKQKLELNCMIDWVCSSVMAWYFWQNNMDGCYYVELLQPATIDSISWSSSIKNSESQVNLFNHTVYHYFYFSLWNWINNSKNWSL